MRTKLIVVLVISAFVATATRVMTVTNGQPDGNRHPYVGVAIQFIPDMPGFVTVCSGSALSDDRFLTAAHCFDPDHEVFVSYKSGPPFMLATDFTPTVTFGLVSTPIGASVVARGFQVSIRTMSPLSH